MGLRNAYLLTPAGQEDANNSEKGLLKKAILPFTAILSIGTNDKYLSEGQGSLGLQSIEV